MNTLIKDSKNKQELSLQNTNYGILDSTSTYVDCFRMYLGYYNKIPNLRSLNFIDTDSFKNWFENKYENQIINQHYKQRFDSPKKELKYIDHFYILKQDVMLNVERNSIYILYTNEQEEAVNILFEECKKFIKIPKKTTDISLIIFQNNKLETKEVHIKKPKTEFLFSNKKGVILRLSSSPAILGEMKITFFLSW